MAAGGLLVAASCSDFNDFNTVPGAADPAADKTLWENISSNDQLSDFASVLERIGYDEVLSASRTYTVWAPVNGSFNLDSLNQVSDEKVEKEFLKNLIADFAHRENDPNDTVIYMLNEKLLKFSNKNTARLSFDAQKVLPNANMANVYNYPSTNGLLYIVSSPSVFRYNGYEYIAEMTGVADSFIKYVKHFENIYLDEANSVKGEIRDGVQHYDDSVMIITNRLTDGLLRAQVDNEDSLYTVLIPTNEAWIKNYEKIASYYNYIPSINYQDLSSSEVGTKKGNTGTILKGDVGKVTANLPAVPADAAIQEAGAYWTDSITKLRMVRNFFYTETDRRYNNKLATGTPFVENDTLRSTIGAYMIHLQGLNDATQEIVKLSNGHARIINDYPFRPQDTYAPIIETVEPGRLVTATGSGIANYRVMGVDPEIWTPETEYQKRYGLSFVSTDLPEKSTFAPELDFYIPNVLSTTYTVYAIMVPDNVSTIFADTVRKPYSLYFDINYTDAENNQISARFDGDTIQVGNSNVKKVEPFLVAQHKVDTVKLGRVTFPICYAGTEAKPNIKVMHTVSSFVSTNKKKYQQVLRIAGIRLVPDGTELDD